MLHLCTTSAWLAVSPPLAQQPCLVLSESFDDIIAGGLGTRSLAAAAQRGVSAQDDGRPKNLKERQEMEEKTHFHGKQAVNAVTGRSWVWPCLCACIHADDFSEAAATSKVGSVLKGQQLSCHA